MNNINFFTRSCQWQHICWELQLVFQSLYWEILCFQFLKTKKWRQEETRKVSSLGFHFIQCLNCLQLLTEFRSPLTNKQQVLYYFLNCLKAIFLFTNFGENLLPLAWSMDSIWTKISVIQYQVFQRRCFSDSTCFLSYKLEEDPL